jgi:histidine triad (HIT) family protein
MDYLGTDFYCDVAIKGLITLKKEYESNKILAFHHTKPYWPVHIVVIPKKHIDSFTSLSAGDTPVLLELIEVMKTIVARVEKEHGSARIVTNLGTYQDSKHLHFHISSGDPIK